MSVWRQVETRIPPPLIMLAVGCFMTIARSAGGWFYFADSVSLLVICSGTGVGVATILAGLWSFRTHHTTVNPLNPQKASCIVETGVFSRSRNPMYLGMLIILLSYGVYLGSLYSVAASVLFVPLITRLQIIPEERQLLQKFPLAYRRYQQRVRRWI